MDVILASVNWQFELVYLDDVIILSNSRDDLISQVRSVLMIFGNAGVTLKLRKYFFLQDRIDYIGHVIRPGSLEVTPKVTKAIKNIIPPRNVNELRSLLGL